jgi:uncharacterized protein YlxW (UPF0749 family)
MTGPAPAARSRDAVVQLLGSIWDDALDPGYAAAAARAGRRPAVTRRRGGALAVLGFALVGLVLAVALLSTHAAAPAVAERRADLVDRVHEQTARADTADAQVQALQAEVSRLKATQLSATTQGERLASTVAGLELASGQVAVSGPGVRVTLDDAPEPPPGTQPDLDRVLDRDLQGVVNGLWAAGAEAVAVNGVRLTSLSAIRAAGDAILVDYRPLTRPYLVTAVGDPSTLESRFASGAAGRTLVTLQQTYGITYSLDAADRVEVPAASASALRYAQPREGTP